MAATCLTVAKIIEEIAPPGLAFDWDNVGFQVGNPYAEIQSVLVTLDVTDEVVREAEGLRVGLIVTHHPLIFQPLKNLLSSDYPGSILYDLIRNNINLYAAHTNLDRAQQGTNFYLSQALGLQRPEVLEQGGEALYKIVVYVPVGHEDAVREALGAAGAGWIGEYASCTFRTPGKGTFMPMEGTNPFIGSPGRVEEVDEYRLETVVPESLKKNVLNAVQKTHPYEEPAYDVFRLAYADSRTGLGRVGYLQKEMSLGDFARCVQDCLGVSRLRVVGSPRTKVARVAVCGGSGGGMISAAAAKEADVLVTGDVKYHDALLAEQLGLNIIDAGHHATEMVLVPGVARYLGQRLEELGENNVQVFISEISTNPWRDL